MKTIKLELENDLTKVIKEIELVHNLEVELRNLKTKFFEGNNSNLLVKLEFCNNYNLRSYNLKENYSYLAKKKIEIELLIKKLTK